ncbi:SusC/RagA family TonB-linked outer membrane protein [Chitinophaga sp. sic0106]|uniref:SusC/RagA family TonB-linked outer membrane protein n=1 Tax=Chitinophaga sp. sic0106 TaxID=2854785 RepID=UPI001C471846|nr:SusC/RagA family TonB-linked outer membrane protein [Chitinophaga sp. sic0106]MBV7529172.1 SusC/RagA family TonB-linked outer membrane protein [Chitinophaga sp. sic0106]
MKLTFCLTLFFALHISAKTMGQRITIEARAARLESVFEEIKLQTGYTFVYRDDLMAQSRKVDLHLQDATLKEVLEVCFKNQPFTYSITQTAVVLRKKEDEPPVTAPAPVQQEVIIRGKVTDEKGEPIPGASVALAGQSKGVATRTDGSFELKTDQDNVQLQISSIGFKTQTINASSKSVVRVILKTTDQSLSQVVVTGMFTRNKNSFSGKTDVYTGEQLKTVSNNNVVQALRTLDPSFLVMENNMAGSNPNVLPTIELRGQSAISSNDLRDQFSGDPNQPLFMLDGFEASLRQIVDLDINRIASITVLKDAASTAIYGSRAANGVVVVETIRTGAGKVTLSYTHDLSVDAPDLTSYNMMNAREKLEFEKLAGRYVANGVFDQPIDQFLYYDSLYSRRLQDVERGVNTYWLNEPVRTGITQRHSLYAGGGSGPITFDAGGSYRKVQGVMKGSGRDEWSGRLTLGYRTGKVNISNSVFVQGYSSTESPYGSFSTWVNTNPYFEKLPSYEPYLDKTRDKTNSNWNNLMVKNPLYAAAVGNYDKSKSLNITNNLNLTADVTDALRISGGLQLASNNLTGEVYRSPRDLQFDKTDPSRKGTYNNTKTNTFNYAAWLMLTYYKMLGKHMINANLRSDISEVKNKRESYLLEGFPMTANGNPRFAFDYALGSVPGFTTNISRKNKVLGSVNYSYDNRYSFDGTVAYDGSTSFGAANKYSPFYSVGARWNLAKEGFLKNTTWINQLSLRANIGVTGNQNFNAFSSISTYVYNGAAYVNAVGLNLATKGNVNLQWQNTTEKSTGMDAAFLGGRLKLSLDYYEKRTSPLVIAVSLPASTGLTNYPFNAGTLTTKGQEFRLSYSIIANQEKGITWTLSATGSHYTSRYSDLNKYLDVVNDKLREANALVQYRDGYAPDDLWAVPSLGIDPATGREIFLKKNGTQTFDYDYKDRVVMGNTRPNIQGVVSSYLSVKNFVLNLSCRYIQGQDAFNTALYDKVENISFEKMANYNQDKRALYERWKKPGDQTQFKGISIYDKSYMSSRFVQEENTFSLESASLSYTFRDKAWLRNMHLSNIRLMGMTNELFRISTIKRERGISYPYARTFSFTLSASLL